jgi:hypothetical protein
MKRSVVTMRLAVVLAFVFGSMPMSAQIPAAAPKKAPAKVYTPPRTPWGDPDLAGVYTNKDENGIPVERPSQFEGKKLEDVDESEFTEIVKARNEASVSRAPGIGGAETGAGPVHWYEHYDAKNSRPWLITDPADGRIPPTTRDAEQRAAARAAARVGRGPADSYEDRSLYDQCITRGLPGSMMPAIYGNSYEIVQAPGMVAIRYEMVHETRVIPIDGRKAIPEQMQSYMGDSRGHWDGDTLVVEGSHYLESSAFGGASSKLKTIERFRPTSKNTIEWSITFDDATTWVKPWTFGMRLTRDDEHPIFEYACHEGNEGLRGILSAARAAEKEQAVRPSR